MILTSFRARRCKKMEVHELSNLDFLESEVDDTTLSQICQEMEVENEALEGLSQISLSQMIDKYDTDMDYGQFKVEFNIEDGVISGDRPINVKFEDEIVGSGSKLEKSRFARPVSDYQMEQLIEQNKNSNTSKNTHWAYGVFSQWRRERGDVPELNEMTAQEMDMYLGRFLVEARRQDGNEYPGLSLYLLVCGLLRHLKDNGVSDKNFLDSKDFRFAHFRKIFDSRMKELVKKGLGTDVKKADAILPEDEEKIWEKGVFSDSTAETLQCTMFFYSCKLFGLRGHDEHHDLKCEQFKTGQDTKGKFVEFIGRASKTYNGGLYHKELTNKNIRHYSEVGDRCIVSYYEKYLTALGSGKFYRRSLAGTPPRYGEQPVGINKLKNFMKVICDRAGLIGNFTNHSGKRTCATQLYMVGVDEQEIMRRTGHRSEKAVRKYKESSSDISARVSKVLDPPKRKCDEMRDGNENQNENITSVKKMCVDIPIGSSALGDISNRPFFNNCSIAFNYN